MLKPWKYWIWMKLHESWQRDELPKPEKRMEIADRHAGSQLATLLEYGSLPSPRRRLV
jgi:hypothetical protein